ncbi:glycosyltransferase [Aureococcus anophagefferens]|nr:glycosyltransferase [Aureococcus anophagefferens]
MKPPFDAYLLMRLALRDSFFVRASPRLRRISRTLGAAAPRLGKLMPRRPSDRRRASATKADCEAAVELPESSLCDYAGALEPAEGVEAWGGDERKVEAEGVEAWDGDERKVEAEGGEAWDGDERKVEALRDDGPRVAPSPGTTAATTPRSTASATCSSTALAAVAALARVDEAVVDARLLDSKAAQARSAPPPVSVQSSWTQ